jgi:phage terminase small subunit
MTKRTTAKPKAKTKARRATKPKPAPTVIMKSAEGIEAETIVEEPKLTLKQERFCQAYIENGGNATDAYRTVYDASDMKSESINVAACELTKHPKISVRLDQLRADALRRHQITMDRILAEYSKLAFANMRDYTRITDDRLATVDLSRIDDDQAAAIQEVKVDRVRTIGNEDSEEKAYVERITFKLADKRSALDSLSKCLGLFVEKRELTGADGKDLFPPAPSSRDLGRAILDVLREAQIEGQEPNDGEVLDCSPAVAAAAADLPAAADDMIFDETTGSFK